MTQQLQTHRVRKARGMQPIPTTGLTWQAINTWLNPLVSVSESCMLRRVRDLICRGINLSTLHCEHTPPRMRIPSRDTLNKVSLHAMGTVWLGNAGNMEMPFYLRIHTAASNS